ncbi:MAG: glycosyltransferase [Thiobacillus sp.]|nr:glycosyltransferase [Thiobacillus sp.]
MSAPEVSVVMSVYNGAEHLAQTLTSILTQEDCDLEFIVVDDGSTDDTERLLDEWAIRDSRLRVVHQQNTGLTRALIRGCAEARGEFIARQDAGDVSLPGRLAAQCAYLRTHPDTVMLSSGACFRGPADEMLYEVRCEGEALDRGLSSLDVQTIQGPPHHGSTMFRRQAYLEAGGYRLPFVVAQDIDLWLRLADLGHCWGLGDIHYEARLAAGSISGQRREEQIRAAKLAIECARLRRRGQSDQTLVEKGLPASAHAGGAATSREQSRFFYFVGACLSKRDPASARRYFWRAARENPLFLKALARSILG